MKIKFKIENRILIPAILLLCLIGIICFAICCSDYSYLISFHLSIFYFVTIGSGFYSQSIIRNDLFYKISFGITRKEVYNTYIKNITFILLITIVFSITLLISMFLLLENLNLLKVINDFHYFFLIPFYFFVNMLFFSLGISKKYKYYSYPMILVISAIMFVSKFIYFMDLIGIIILVMAIYLFIQNKILIRKLYIS